MCLIIRATKRVLLKTGCPALKEEVVFKGPHGGNGPIGHCLQRRYLCVAQGPNR